MNDINWVSKKRKLQLDIEDEMNKFRNSWRDWHSWYLGITQPLERFHTGIVEPGAALLAQRWTGHAAEKPAPTYFGFPASRESLEELTARYRKTELPRGVKGALEFVTEAPAWMLGGAALGAAKGALTGGKAVESLVKSTRFGLKYAPEAISPKKIPKVVPRTTPKPPAPEVYQKFKVKEALKLKETEKNLSVLSDNELQRQLGKGTEGWNQDIYSKIKAGETTTVYRVVPKGIDKINIGDRVTHSRESAQAVAREMYLSGEYNILSVQAKPGDLIVQMPNEFLYVPKLAIPKAKVFSRITPEIVAPREDIADLVKVFREQSVARKATTIVRKVELRKRIIAAQEAFDNVMLKTGDIEQARIAQRMQLKGAMPTETGGLQSVLSKEALTKYRMEIAQNPTLRFFESDRADRALYEFFDDPQRLWQPNELKLLEKIFPGIGELNAIKAKITATKWTQMMDAANIPRALLASGDFSMTARQGAPLIARRPYLLPGTMKWQFKTLFSPKNWDKLDDIIRSDPDFDLFAAQKHAYLAPKPGALGKLAAREETYQSSFAERIPAIGKFIRASERSYTAGLNYLRFQSFKRGLEILRKANAMTDVDVAELAKLVSVASGRGTLPKQLSGVAPLLNGLMFSPRLVISKFQLPAMLFSQSPVVRKEAVKTLVSMLGFGASILSLAKLQGAEVEADPRSSDFGKIKIGNTRLDIWTGYLQWARFFAQFITNERKVAGTGKIQDLDRIQTIWRMMQSKGSPIAGLIVDLLAEENYLGEPMFEGGSETAVREIRNRLTPLFAQDLWDAIETDGLMGGAAASPGAFGVGVVSYKPRDTGGIKFQYKGNAKKGFRYKK